MNAIRRPGKSDLVARIQRRAAWLQSRNNGGSLQKFLRSRERLVHLSASLVERTKVIAPGVEVAGVVTEPVTLKWLEVDKTKTSTRFTDSDAYARCGRKDRDVLVVPE